MDSDRGPDPSPEFREYCGDGRPHPRPLPNAPETPEPYVASEPLRQAVNTALFLRRPLLLEGEPGTGKTRLAHAVAYELGYPLKEIYIRSTSRAQELLYTFDAVRRLYDIQEQTRPGTDRGSHDNADQAEALKKYVRFGKLEEAIELAMKKIPSVVLIDEIDKADLDFPNDLLLVLDRMQFEVSEVPNWKFDASTAGPGTSAGLSSPWSSLPATARRSFPPRSSGSLLFFIPFPNEKELELILQKHSRNDLTPLFTAALKRFWELRNTARFPGRNHLAPANCSTGSAPSNSPSRGTCSTPARLRRSHWTSSPAWRPCSRPARISRSCGRGFGTRSR